MNKHLKFFFGIVSVSPVLFLVSLAISFALYVKFPYPLVTPEAVGSALMVLGIVLILGGTALAFAAQRVSRVVTNPKYKATCPDLMQGPYAYSRHPGSLSLIMMYVGFALVANSLIMVIVAGLIVLLLTLVFVPMEEKIISALCPEAYAEYKQRVRMWL